MSCKSCKKPSRGGGVAPSTRKSNLNNQLIILNNQKRELSLKLEKIDTKIKSIRVRLSQQIGFDFKETQRLDEINYFKD